MEAAFVEEAPCEFAIAEQRLIALAHRIEKIAMRTLLGIVGILAAACLVSQLTRWIGL